MNKSTKQVLVAALLIVVLVVILYALYVLNYRPAGFTYKDF